MASQEGSLHGFHSAIAGPTTKTRPFPISRNLSQHKTTDVVSKTRMTNRFFRPATQLCHLDCSPLQRLACHRLMRLHHPVFHKGLLFFSACGCGAKGPERWQHLIGTHRPRKLHPADARLQLYAPRPLRLLAAISDILGVFVLVFLFSSCATFGWPSQGQQHWALIV
jgi:hypothetical protein